MKSTEMRTERVEQRPDEMVQGVAYLTPNGAHWPMSSENPLTVSPSILRKSLDCQSHYFITDGKVVWC